MSSDWALFLNDDKVNTVSRVAATLYFFEYAITLDREMDCIWRRRFSGAAALVVVNRYAMLAASIASLVQSIPRSHYFLASPGAVRGYVHDLDGSTATGLKVIHSRCQSLVRFIDICTFFMYTTYAVFAALRMYALYGMRKSVFIPVLLVGSLSPIVQIALMCLGTIESNSGRGDVIDIPMCTKVTDGYAPSVLIVALRAVALCFEALLLVLTWCKTVALWRTLKQTASASLSAMILRDGTMYFVIITIALALNLHATTGLFDYTTYISVPLYDLTPMVDTITSICMTRFILNLRSVSTAGETESGPGTTMRFATADVIVGNLGAQLRDTFSDDGEDARWGEEAGDAAERDGLLSVGATPEPRCRVPVYSTIEA